MTLTFRHLVLADSSAYASSFCLLLSGQNTNPNCRDAAGRRVRKIRFFSAVFDNRPSNHLVVRRFEKIPSPAAPAYVVGIFQQTTKQETSRACCSPSLNCDFKGSCHHDPPSIRLRLYIFVNHLPLIASYKKSPLTVKFLMNITQMFVGDVRVNLCGANVSVA